MLQRLAQIAGVNLSGYLAQLQGVAENFRDRSLAQVKHQGMSIGIAIALAMTGLVFAVLAAVAGFIALYLWLEPQYGPFVALGAVGGSAILIALVLFTAASMAANRQPPPWPKLQTPAMPKALSSLSGADLADKAAAATKHTLDGAVDTVRHGSREAVLTTLAATVVLGVMLGRRR